MVKVILVKLIFASQKVPQYIIKLKFYYYCEPKTTFDFQFDQFDLDQNNRKSIGTNRWLSALRVLSRTVIIPLLTITFYPQQYKNRAKSPRNLHRFTLYLDPQKPQISPTFAPKLAKTALNHGEKHQNLSLWEQSDDSLRSL